MGTVHLIKNATRNAPSATDAETSPEDVLRAFPSETGGPGLDPTAGALSRRRWPLAVLVTAVIVLGVAGVGSWQYRPWAAGAPATGSLRIESDPADAEVRLDGILRGRTPLTLDVPSGSHVLHVQRGAREEQLTVSVAGGARTVHHISWRDDRPAATARADAAGRLNVVAEQPGAVIVVDGVRRGASPLLVDGLAAGEHQVEVRRAGVVRRRTVQVRAGSTVSLVFGGGAPAVTSGWMTVSAGIPLQIFENGDLIGTTAAERIMLQSGTHQFAFRDDALGFSETREVTIAPGRTARVSLALPTAPLSLNATPWAEVWIDGARVGETPLGKVMQPIGPHQIEFRHPELGTRTRVATVTLSDIARVAVDMRAPQ